MKITGTAFFYIDTQTKGTNGQCKRYKENTLLLDRLRDFVVVPSSAGGNSSFELHSQSMEERATLDRYHHFHVHSGMCA